MPPVDVHSATGAPIRALSQPQRQSAASATQIISRLALVIALTGSPACIPPRVIPSETGQWRSSKAPDPERIKALMAVESTSEDFGLRVMALKTQPSAVLAGGYTWAVCTVPRHYVDTGRIRLEGHWKAIDNPLEQMETRLLLGPVECGSHAIRCTVTRYGKPEFQQITLTVVGSGCDGA